MTLLEAIDQGPKALTLARLSRTPNEARRDLQKLQKAGVIYWVPAMKVGQPNGYRVHGHWARFARAPKT